MMIRYFQFLITPIILLHHVVAAIGKETEFLQNRIYGGTLASNKRYPYFAFIEAISTYSDDDYTDDFYQERESILCGGMLISNNVIMTAAHCIDSTNLDSVEITFHSNKNVERNVTDWEIHSNYEIKQRNVRNDIALLYLKDSSSSDEHVSPVDIQFDGRPDPDDIVSVMGFGATNDGESDQLLTEDLNEVSLGIMENTYCRTIFGSVLNTDLQFCTGNNGEIQKGACKGDSGGPAIIKQSHNDGESDVLVGIVSFGAPRCSMGLTVYTRISGHENWIKSRVCEREGSTTRGIRPAWCGDIGKIEIGLNFGDMMAEVIDKQEATNKEEVANLGFLGCFSGSDSWVDVRQQRVVKKIRMKDLNIGDEVHVGNNMYEPIYSFGHRAHRLSPENYSDMIRIRTKTSTLTLTPNHLVFAQSQDDIAVPIPASQIRVGDRVVGKNPTVVLSVKKTREDNSLFSPFTPSGRIVVNDILASNYIAFENTQTLRIMGIGWNHHWLAHTALTPYRFICYTLLGTCKDYESYSEDEGISKTLIPPLRFFQRWVFDNTGTTKHNTSLLSLVIALLVMLHLWNEIIILAVKSPFVMLLSIVILYYYYYRQQQQERRQSSTTKKKKIIITTHTK